MDTVTLKSKATVLYVFLMLGGLFILNGCIEDFSNEIPQKTAAKNKWYATARAYMKQGLYDSALVAADMAISQAIAKKDSLLLGNTYFLKGYTYWRQDNDAEALTNYFYALEAYKNIDNVKIIGEIINNIGRVHEDEGNLEEAIKKYNESYVILKSDSNLALKIKNNIGRSYSKASLYQEAITNFQQALSLAIQLNDKGEIVRFKNNLSVAYLYLEDYINAEKLGLEALDLYQEIGDKKRSALILNNLALVYYKTGQSEKAETHFLKSIKIHEEHNNLYLSDSYNNIAELYLEKKDFQQADLYLTKALALETKDMEERSRTYELKSTLAEAQGNLQLLANYQKQVINLKDSIHTKQMALNTIGRKNLALIAQVEGKIRMSRIEHENEMQKTKLAFQRKLILWIVTAAVFLIAGMIVVVQYWQVRKLNLRLEAYTKNMVQTVNHQLNAIASYAYLAQMRLDLLMPPPDEEDITEMEGFLKGIKNMVHAIASVNTQLINTKKVSKNKSKSDLYNTVHAVEANMKVYHAKAQEKNITLEEDVISQPMVTVHGETLIQAVGGLVSNAIKYSPEGSTVTVRLYDEENKVYLQVIDEGPGIAEKDKKKLFKKGAKLHNRKDVVSSGVGLYFAKKDIKEMGGEIEHENRPEGGSVFTIKFSKMM